MWQTAITASIALALKGQLPQIVSDNCRTVATLRHGFSQESIAFIIAETQHGNPFVIADTHHGYAFVIAAIQHGYAFIIADTQHGNAFVLADTAML